MSRPSNPKIRTPRHVTLDVETYLWLAAQSQARRPAGLGYVIDDLVNAEIKREKKRNGTRK